MVYDDGIAIRSLPSSKQRIGNKVEFTTSRHEQFVYLYFRKKKLKEKKKKKKKNYILMV